VPEAKPAEQAKKKKKGSGLEVAAGVKVDIHGLVGAAQYNGREGLVVAGPNEKCRWKVQVSFEGDLKDVALKEENLQPKPTCGWELVVAAISESSVEADVIAAFKEFGSVQSCKVTRDIDGISKSVALIVMDTKENAEKALNTRHDIKVSGVPAKVQWSTMVKQQMGLLTTRDEEFGEGAEETSTRKFKEASPDAPKSGPFKLGQPVHVSGLKGAAQYNGTIGIVKGYRPDGRCEVSIIEAGKPEKILALKLENLSIDAPTAKANTATEGEEANDDAPRRRRFSDGETKAPRQRASLWGEGNDGGEVYVGGAAKDAKPSTSETPQDAEPLPDEASLIKMSAKDLKLLLVSHKVDVAGCYEKSEFLERARALIS
jgi:hypothetical protein